MLTFVDTTKEMAFSGVIRTLQFARRRHYLVVATDPGVVTVISTRSWSILAEQPLGSCVGCVAFSYQDDLIAAGLQDGQVALLSKDQDWTSSIDWFTGMESSITSLAWSKRHLVVARKDGNVGIYKHDSIVDESFSIQKDASHGDTPVNSVAFGVGGTYLGELLFRERFQLLSLPLTK